MEIKNTPVSAAGNKRKKSFLSVLKEKFGSIIAAVSAAMTMQMLTAASAFAESGGGDGGAAPLDTKAGEAEFYAVIEFFAKWIGRIGLVVGFVGAIMFALAIKNDDAEAKTRGLMTLASGFVVFAVTGALNMFMK